MKARRSISCLFTILTVFISSEALATQKSTAVPGESRLRVFNYQPNTVFEYTGFLKYAARIDFDPEEKFLSITMGDQTAWQITPQGSTLFLKPTDLDATTNMVIITNKRTYYFEMYAKEAESINDGDLVFATKFNYPDSNPTSGDSGFIDFSSSSTDTANTGEEKKSYVPDPVKDAPMLNMNYTMSGDKDIAPIEVFDDGEFTYLKFKNINADYPAIFQVLPDGNEALINFRVSDNGYVVIERVTSQFTLRFGGQMACVFNEKLPLKRVGKKDKDKSFFGVF